MRASLAHAVEETARVPTGRRKRRSTRAPRLERPGRGPHPALTPEGKEQGEWTGSQPCERSGITRSTDLPVEGADKPSARGSAPRAPRPLTLPHPGRSGTRRVACVSLTEQVVDHALCHLVHGGTRRLQVHLRPFRPL